MSERNLASDRPAAALRRVWRAALVLFVLAGATGVLFRMAVALGWGPGEMGGLLLGNVRHAHSHLMYFGWATPALMALITAVVRRRAGRRMRGAGAVLAGVLLLALLAYPPFLLWGYAPARLGGARLPLSVIAAGLNVIGWYAFAVVYARATRGVTRDAPLRIFDLALVFLIFSTLGAWGLPAVAAADFGGEPLKAALTHFFLDTFSEGWFVLGVLALAYAAVPDREDAPPLWPVYVAAAGVPFTFAAALPDAFVPPLWRVLAALGGGAVAAGLLAAVAGLWRRLPAGAAVWRAALVLLAFKAAGQFAVALAPEVDWAAYHGLRVLYLHLMLLGFVSLGLFAAARTSLGMVRGARAMTAAVLLLIASLAPLSGFWPAALGGLWTLHAAAVVAATPVLAAAYALVAPRR